MAGETIESVFRDFQTAGVPSSGAHEPVKSEIRNLLNALVFGDAPGGAVIELNNAGTGTGDAIEVTTAEPIPDAAWKAIYVLNVTHENTGPVTVSINGAAAIPVVDNTGQPLIAGALVPGMGVLALDDGTNLRLFVYGDVEALLNEIRETTKPYLGASATAPTTRTDGSALVAGDQYFDTTQDRLKVWTGSAWIGGTGDVLSTNNGSDFEDPVEVSANLSYQTGETGTLPRSLISKLSDRRSLYDFGAVGDGSADDTAAVQAWLNAGGGIVPEGQFVISGPVTREDGTNNAPSMIAEQRGKAEFLFVDPTASIMLSGQRPTVRNLKFTPVGIVSNGLILGLPTVPSYSIDNALVEGCMFERASTTSYFEEALDFNRVWYSTIRGNSFEGPSDATVKLNNKHIVGRWSVNNVVTDNTVGFGGTFVEWSDDAGPNHCEGWVINNNAAAGIACFVEAKAGILVIIKGNVIDIVSRAGAILSSTKNIVSGNWFGMSNPGVVANGVELTGARYSIVSDNEFVMNSDGSGVALFQLEGVGSDKSRISGNTFDAGDYGVRAVDAVSGLQMTDNMFNGQGVKYYDLGAAVNSYVRGNYLDGGAGTYTSPASGTSIAAEWSEDPIVTMTGGTSQTISITVPSGVFTAAPDIAQCGSASGGNGGLAFYLKSSSTATSLVFEVYPRPGQTNLPSAPVRYSVQAIQN